MNKKLKAQVKAKTNATKPTVKPPKTAHVHDWKVFINHMTEAPEGQRCPCGAQEWF